jgi:hypothetical protein
VSTADRCGPRGSPTGSASHSGGIILATALSYRYVISISSGDVRIESMVKFLVVK